MSSATLLETKSWSSTETVEAKFSHTWTVRNLSCFPDTDKFISSPSFFSSSKAKLRMEPHPKGNLKRNQDFLSLFLKAEINDGIRVKINFSIVNKKGERKERRFMTSHLFTKLCPAWGYGRFVTRDFLFDEKNMLLSDDDGDVLTILCEGCVLLDGVSHVTAQTDVIKIPDCKIADDFSALFESSRFADVTLLCAGREFSCHKAVLAARSSVFAAMFEHDMLEKKYNRVEVKEMDPDVLACMLSFVYTGSADLEDLAAGLLEAADRYGLDRLKAICERSLAGSLTAQNVSGLLVLADRHSARQLKALAVDFVAVNLHGSVGETVEWKEMVETNKSLAEEVMGALAKRHKSHGGKAPGIRGKIVQFFGISALLFLFSFYA